jgi:putrescine aminotransferase
MPHADDTRRWRELDRRHHLHPFSNPAELASRGVRIITRAQGCWLWDSAGNRILDGMAGLWCVNVGYGRAELVEAARRQMASLPFYNTFFQTATPPVVELAARLAEIAPAGLERVFFTNSGSEANDTAVKLVRFFWNLKGQPRKKTIISRNYGYHGVTLCTRSRTCRCPVSSMCRHPTGTPKAARAPRKSTVGSRPWRSSGGSGNSGRRRSGRSSASRSRGRAG